LKFGKLTLCVFGDGELQCSRGRTYPVWPKANRTVFITENGFDAAKLTVALGEVIEFVNLDVRSRVFSSSRNLAAQANGTEALNEDDDAVRLEVGESYNVQVSAKSITYYDSQNSTESITLETATNAVYLPVVRR
jgi:plastocyanin